MTRRLSGLDSSFLYAESSTMPLHGGSITILDPSTAPDDFGIDHVRRDIAARLDRLVPFRLQVSAPALGLGRPVWVDTRGIDLDRHIHAAAVPRPGTPRQLADLAAELFARPLARDRPLWQLWFVEGLEGGRVALIWKAHHALMGGVEVTNLLRLLYDIDVPVAEQEAPPSDPGEQLPSALAVAARAAVDVTGVPIRIARLLGESALAAVRVSGFLLGGGRPASTLPFAGPKTSLNGALVADRSCAFASLSLDDVKTVKNALGVKVNDVVLAVCSAALRSYLEDRGELPSRSLNATVMAAVGGIAGAHGGAVLGNATSILGNVKWHYNAVINVLPRIEMIAVNEWWWSTSCEWADIVFAADSWAELKHPDMTASVTNPFLQVFPRTPLPRIFETVGDIDIQMKA